MSSFRRRGGGTYFHSGGRDGTEKVLRLKWEFAADAFPGSGGVRVQAL